MRLRTKQRGQVAVFYALLVPVFLFLGGVGLDLGWYYLNVSRLQNAADAAVLVGANALLKEWQTNDNATYKDYKVKLVYQYPKDNPDETINITTGDNAAYAYAKKNLASESTGYSFFAVAEAAESYTFRDSYTRGDPTVTLKPSLYKDGEDYYYVIGLQEDIHHFFIGFLDDMSAGVVAVARLSKSVDGGGGGEPTPPVSDSVVITFDANDGKFSDDSTTASKTFKSPDKMEDDETSEPINSGKGVPTNEGKTFLGWSTNPNPSAGETIDYIYDGKQLTKTEMDKLFGNSSSVTLYAVWKDSTSTAKPHNNRTLWEQMQYLIAENVYHYYYGASEKKYGKEPIIKRFNNVKVYYRDNSNRNYYAEVQDFNSDMRDDNRNEISKQTHYYIDFWQADNNLTFQNTDSNNKRVSATTERDIIGQDKNGTPCPRIHALFNVNGTYTARNGYADDPLYFRIEAEPYKSETTPIRQIVININADNTADGLRPLFFYYDGPDARATKNVEPGILRPDMAQPVILNLNADFKGVLWMPDIPVVINGNGHKFEGFIIAKEYRYLATQGTQVKYSTTGKNDGNYSDNDIHVDDNGNVYSLVAEGNSALALWNNGNNVFGLNQNSHFKKFKAASKVNYAYVYYDFDLKLDKTAFYNDLTGELIPLYKKDAQGNQVRVTRWEDVRLFAEDRNGNLQEVPKEITSNNLSTIRLLTRSSKLKTSTDLNAFRGIVLLDGDDTNNTGESNPIPLYDEAGNPVYFCEDYAKFLADYEVFTLDTLENGSHGDKDNSKEFLLTKTDTTNVSDTEDWI